MSTKAHRAKAQARPDFITATELAAHLGVATETVSDWAARGLFPEPWSVVGYVRLWRRDHYEHFRDTGLWPAEARRDKQVVVD